MNNIAKLPTATDSINSSKTLITELVEPTSFYSSSSNFDLSAEISSLQANIGMRDWMLISTLERAYKVYAEVESASDDQQQTYLEQLENLRITSGITTKPRKSYTKIATLVFIGSEIDRQLISVYGNVLKNALLAKIKVSGFIEWLKDVGGIDAASRLNRQPKEQKPPEDVLQYLNYIAPIGKVNSKNMSDLVNSDEFVLAVVSKNASSDQVRIHRIISDQIAVENAVRPYADEIRRRAFKNINDLCSKTTTPAVKAVCFPTAEIEQQ